MDRIHYLAYGSNLHPLRLQARAPSARPLGVVPLPGRRLSFHKWSHRDHSGKCDLVAATGTAASYGVLYEIEDRDKAALDAAECLGRGYEERQLEAFVHAVPYRAFLYVAQASHIDPELRPYHWYKALVVAGARYHKFPAGYLAELRSVRSVPDPDRERAAAHEALLARMRRY